MRMRGWALLAAAAVGSSALARIELPVAPARDGLAMAAAATLALLGRPEVARSASAPSLGAAGVEACRHLQPHLPLLAIGALLALVFAARAVRARSVPEMALHVVLGFASGLAASWLGRAQDGLEATLFAGALAGAALLASAPWLGARRARVRGSSPAQRRTDPGGERA